MARRELVQRFEVVFEPDEDGGFHVYVPALKGCHSCGLNPIGPGPLRYAAPYSA